MILIRIYKEHGSTFARLYSSTRGPAENFISRREHTRASISRARGNRGVKSNGFNFCLDSPTSLLLYTQLAIYVVEPLVHPPTPPGSVIQLGASFSPPRGLKSARMVCCLRRAERAFDRRIRRRSHGRD